MASALFLKRSGTKEKRSRASHYYADIAQRHSTPVLRRAGCRMPDILHQKQEVIKAMCKISLLLLHHYRQEAPKRKYTPSGSAQKMRHFHHFLASFYPRQKKVKNFNSSHTYKKVWIRVQSTKNSPNPTSPH